MRIWNLVLVAILIGWAMSSRAQMTAEDKDMIREVEVHEVRFDPRKPSFLRFGNNPVINYSPITLTFGGLLWVYQKAISPQLQSKCPYEVSCSAFSKVAIQEFGIIKGIPLTADRLTRCTQFTLIDILPSQIDPETGFIKDPLHKYKLHHNH